jgi:hypothetical protein
MNGPVGEDLLWVEVDDDRFTEPVQRQFKRIGAPLRVVAVDLDGAGPRPVHALAVGPAGEVALTPAWACAVEDSGSGVAWLVYGGAAGLWVDGAGSSPAQVPAADAPGAVFDAFLLVERAALVEG